MKKTILLLSFVLFSLFMYAQTGIEGVWYNTDKTGKVEIYKKGEVYYGKIIWLKEPINTSTGKPKVDENNPETSKRTALIIGLVVLKNFSYEGDKVYSGGTIYDPENGKTYKCKMTLIDKDHLDVRGYIGVPALGRTENWTRTTK
jgi:uncharacterized protein (DUF2147 family)